MNNRPISKLLLASGAFALLLPTAQAGHQVAPACNECKEAAPVREWFPDDPAGLITVGTQFSEHLTGFYVDNITGIWAPQSRDAFFFLDSKYHWEDNGQFINSTGLAFRKLLPERQVIIGGNVFWDSIHGENGSDFDQLGLGAEVLTHWVDARFNYYLPEDDQVVFDQHTNRSATRTTKFQRREAGLEGLNAEVGFLLPLCKYTEVRVYAGYYWYENPFGSDFSGFKARLEARILPGVIADVEYWDDAALMGGHWTAGVRASVPFSIYNLVTGRNPFEGAGEMFHPRAREFKERMGDMIERSHRIQTVSNTTEHTTFHETAPLPSAPPNFLPLE